MKFAGPGRTWALAFSGVGSCPPGPGKRQAVEFPQLDVLALRSRAAGPGLERSIHSLQTVGRRSCCPTWLAAASCFGFLLTKIPHLGLWHACGRCLPRSTLGMHISSCGTERGIRPSMLGTVRASWTVESRATSPFCWHRAVLLEPQRVRAVSHEGFG